MYYNQTEKREIHTNYIIYLLQHILENRELTLKQQIFLSMKTSKGISDIIHSIDQ